MANELQPLPREHALAPVSAHLTPPPAPPSDVVHLLRAIFLRRRLVAAIFLAVVLLVGLYSFLAPPMYECTGSLLVQQNELGLGGGMNAGASALGSLLGGGAGPSVSTETAILNSKQLVAQAVKRSGLNPQRPSDWFLEARDVDKTNVVRVTARAHSLEKATLLCRNLIATYLSFSRTMNREAAGSAARYVQQQMRDAQAKLVAAQDRLRRFKEETGTTALDVETQEQVTRLAEVMQQLEQAKAESRAAQAQLGRVNDLLRTQAPTIVASTSLADNPVAAQLRSTLTDLETERAQALDEYTPTSAVVKNLEARIADVSRRLSQIAREQAETVVREQERAVNPVHQSLLQNAAQLDVSRAAAQARIAALSGTAREGQQRLIGLPRKEFELAQLMREVETYTRTYALLTSRYQELRIAEEAELSNASLMERPKGERRPVTPRRTLNLALAIMLGALLGVGTALLADHFGATAHPDEIPERLGAPLLGEVPALPAGQQVLLAETHAASPLAECYRTIRNNVALGAGGVQALLVTSAGSGEGKSLTALNLATAFARQGKRVLLVDSDLRRPCLHERLGLEAGIGLAEVLTGKSALTPALRQTNIPGLHLLAAGSARSEAMDLLDAGRLRALLAEVRPAYDFILLDSPPALGVSDTQVLADAADGVLLVVGAASAHRSDLAQLRRLLAFVRAQVVGAVINRVDLEAGGRLGRYLGYYHSYGPYLPPDEPGPPSLPA